MFELDNWREILQTLRRHALRTTLTAIGVFWGVLMLIVMVGMGNGLEGGIEKDWGGLATNSIYVWGDRTALPFNGMAPGRYVNLTRADAIALQQSIPDIDAIAPRVSLSSRGGQDVVTRGDHSGPFNVSGDVPAYMRVQPENIVAGRFIDELDIDRKRKVAVIGNHVAETLFPDGADPVGQSISIKHTEFLVVGVFRPIASGDRGDRLGNTIHTPLTTFQQVLRPDPSVNNLAVLMRPGAVSADVDARIHLELAKRHRFSTEDKEAVGTWDTAKEFKKIDSLFTGISLLIWFVGAMTLVAGIVGVSNIMMISVRERTREIGIRRAIGATPWAVIGQILRESTVLTAFAGYLGLLAGFALLAAVGAFMESTSAPGSKSMFVAPTADFGVAVGAIAVVVVGGALAGFFPALYAVRVRPMVALRDE